MTENLSEYLFKPRSLEPETSTLFPEGGTVSGLHKRPTYEGQALSAWYRLLNKPLWTWRGIPPVALELGLSRIAYATTKRSNGTWLDTVIGYRPGNWIYEWIQQGMVWQQQALQLEEEQPQAASDAWFMASRYYSLASYPHILGDNLAAQARIFANRAYRAAIQIAALPVRELQFTLPQGHRVRGFLHLPTDEMVSFPTVLLCGSLESLQLDYDRIFRDYSAPRRLALLTLDMPGVGDSSHWPLTSASDTLHQHVLHQLQHIAEIDRYRVGLLGMRFGAHTAVRLTYTARDQIRATACIAPIVHHALVDNTLPQKLPKMQRDLFLSRLGPGARDFIGGHLETKVFSLKLQGLLGRYCSTPILGLHWEGDLLSPLDEAMLIARSSHNGYLIQVPAGPVHQSFFQGLNNTTEWLQQKLCR